MPKSGTHFLMSILERCLGRKAIAIRKREIEGFSHIRAVAEDYGYRNFLLYGHLRRFATGIQANFSDHRVWRTIALIRDPRDVILSTLDYYLKNPSLRESELFKSLEGRSRAEQIKIMARNIAEEEASRPVPFTHFFDGWIEWADVGALILRYEDIRTGRGAKMLSEKISVPREIVQDAITQAAGVKRHTFHLGRIGRWRSEMDDDVVAFLKSNDRGIVEKLGYSW